MGQFIDWDYHFSCPECGTKYCDEMDGDTANMTQTITCDECDCKFTVHARVAMEITVEVQKV